MANEAPNADERQALLSPPRSAEAAPNNRTEERSAVSLGSIKLLVAVIGN